MAKGGGVGGSPPAIPKYTIRVALIWLLPLFGLLSGSGFGSLWLPVVFAALLTPIEVPKARQLLFSSKARKQLPCLKVPALLRLLVLWVFQVWWLILFRSSSDSSVPTALASGVGADDQLGEDFDATAAGGVPGAFQVDAPLAELRWSPQSMSVVLPCAGEGEFALNTVRSVFESTPPELLREIIVVDDGSSPPLTQSHLGDAVQAKYRVRVIRHESTVGLIGAKKDGGDAARGDVIVFFDCHVAPQPDWHLPFMRLIGENYRRMVVPVITNLDVGTWRQTGGDKGQGKCYLTWDADFKWFNSDDEYVPVISGGLLGMSRRWWDETGGYDEHMSGWGGENLDQSLRTWLCGGEIVIAKDSFVAHMWRKKEDPRTRAHYHVKTGAATSNRLRAAVAWFGEFSEKLRQFPSLQFDKSAWGGGPWYGDVSNILEIKERLHCRSFAWFMHRFKNVYEDGGLVPTEMFHIKHSVSGMCLTFNGQAGTSQDGRGLAVLRRCEEDDDRQRWHGANRDTSRAGQPCCSGLRAWNTDQCLAGGSVAGSKGGIQTFVCELSGHAENQHWALDGEGRLVRGGGRGFMSSGSCLEGDVYGTSLLVQGCRRGSGADGSSQWSKAWAAEPVERQLYQKALDSDGGAW